MLSYNLLLHVPFGLTCWWWLFLAMLVPLLLGLLLGYWLWYQYKRQLAEVGKERDDWHLKYTNVEKDYVSLKYQLEELQKENSSLHSRFNKLESDNAVLKYKLEKLQAESSAVLAAGREPGLAAAGPEDPNIALAGVFTSDDLQIIEGIGPKAEQVLKEAGYGDWAALAGATPEDLSRVLTESSSAFRILDTKSWPEQARFAQEGKWTDLILLQKQLDAGRAETSGQDTPSKVQKKALTILGFSNNPEDLTIIEGIGPKIEQLLKDAGIINWLDLANTGGDRLKEILENAGERYRLADPETWPEQASLAAAGRWRALKDLQDSLQGGRRLD